MPPQIVAMLNGLAGIALFGVAFFAHSKLRLTRVGCVIALIAGLVTFGSPAGDWANKLAAASPWIPFLIVLGLGLVIVADVKGKKKGADKPALIAFYLVPVFFVAFLVALPTVFDDVGDGAEKIGDKMSSFAER